MKFKVTKKEIKNNYNEIYKIGYAELQRLLSRKEPFAYSSGVYGWSCDYYDIDGAVISMGYSPIGKDIKQSKIDEYKAKGELILDDRTLSYDEKDLKVDELLIEFIKEVRKNV